MASLRGKKRFNENFHSLSRRILDYNTGFFVSCFPRMFQIRMPRGHRIGRIGNLWAGRGTAVPFVGVLITVGGGTLQSTGIG